MITRLFGNLKCGEELKKQNLKHSSSKEKLKKLRKSLRPGEQKKKKERAPSILLLRVLKTWKINFGKTHLIFKEEKKESFNLKKN